ncbi:hypothetical protein MLD38_019150 [Melastoma candidum]|uniref:Uncharacterized protein n=1 Tax=Melastoma candidum TaxID=119954 RepID=A0ACB9QXD7_9MYRT|nr:hypothetical protein MLD38_019150 [Melastoma candidum]
MSVSPLLLSSSAYDPSQLQQPQQPTLTNSSALTSYSSTSTSSLTNLSPGIIITLLILSVTIILTTSLCLLFRHFHRLPDFLSLRGHIHRRRNGHSSDSSSESSSRHLSHRPPAAPSPAVANQSLIDSLPLFSFSSVSRRANAAVATTTSSSSAVVDADCAVCLSRFVSHDTLRLLPLCCHAFHSQCIDTWLSSGHDTCPLCRSNVYAAAAAVPAASILHPPASSVSLNGSFRLEIGSVSRRRNDSISDGRRSYSIGSFDYVVDAESEVAVTDRHSRSISDKDDGIVITPSTTTNNNNNNNDLAAELGSDTGTTGGGSRSWLGEYMDRLSATLSSRTASFRGSRRFFTGSSRRSEVAGVGEWDIEASRVGEEISELFRWASGV